MKNVTISMDEETAREARIAAAQEGKSLSRYVGDVLAGHLGARKRRDVRPFLDGPLWDLTDEQGRLPARDEIYADREDQLLRRHESPALREGSPGRREKSGGG